MDENPTSADREYFVSGQIRDDGRCVYCGRDLLTDFDTFWGFLHNDHLVPRKNGGASRAVDNHVTACGSCNNLKGHFVPDDYQNMSREELIAAYRAYIGERRNKYMSIFIKRLRDVRGEQTAQPPG